MSRQPRPSWQKAKRPAHRMPRHDKRGPAPSRAGRRIALWLWSANGERVTTIDALGSADHAPSVCVHEQVRYDKVPRQASSAKVVHYQTQTVVLRSVA